MRQEINVELDGALISFIHWNKNDPYIKVYMNDEHITPIPIEEIIEAVNHGF